MVIFTSLLILSRKKCVIFHHIYINNIFYNLRALLIGGQNECEYHVLPFFVVNQNRE